MLLTDKREKTFRERETIKLTRLKQLPFMKKSLTDPMRPRLLEQEL